MLKRSILTALVVILGLNWVYGENSKNWLKTSSEHFVFIYQEQQRSSVEELLTFCEEIYIQVTGFLASEPKGQIHCILKNGYEYATAYSAAPPAHIVLYITPPKDFLFGAESESWLRILLAHELTHYVHYRWQGGIFFGLARVFGSAAEIRHTIFLPDWFIEGLPTNTETMYTRGGRGSSPFFEMIYRAPVLEGSFFSPSRAAYSSSFPPRSRTYVAGYLLINHINNLYGFDSAASLIREFVKFPFFGLKRIIRKVLGQPFETVFGEMKLDLYLRFEQYRQIPEGDLVSPDDFGNYYGPIVSGDRLYAYRNTLHDVSALVEIDPVTRQETIVLYTTLTDPFSFTVADDTTIVFAALKRDDRASLRPKLTTDLYILPPGRSKPEGLTRGLHLYQPAISPDGKRLIAVQGYGTRSRLVEVDLSTGAAEVLFQTEKGLVFHPVISPDNSTAAFVLNIGGTQDIWLIDMDNPEQTARPLYGPDPYGEYFPRFIDNTTLIFSSDRTGDLLLYRKTIEGTELATLVEDPVGAYYGVVFRDNVFYSSYRSKGYTIERKPYAAQLVSPAEPEGHPQAQEISGKKGQIREESRYFDIPKPFIWLPVPYYVNTIEPFPVQPGAGLFSAGQSIRGVWNWSAAVTSRFDILQPGISVYLEAVTGPWVWGYSFSHAYQEQEGFAIERMYHQAGTQVTLLDRSIFSFSDMFLLSFDVQHLLALYRDVPFSVIDAVQGAGLTTSTQLFISAGVGGLHKRRGSAYDLYSPFIVAGSLSANLPISVSRFLQDGIITQGEMVFGVPSFFRHHQIKFGMKAGFSSVFGYGPSSVHPRGMFTDVWQGDRGTYVGAFDYNMTFALLDTPLILGFNLQGIGGGFHLETLGGWDITAPFFTPYRDIYTGLELVFHIGSSFFNPVPVGLGISLRFDSWFQEPVVLAEDLRPYLFIGVDSFSYFLYARTRSSRVDWNTDQLVHSQSAEER